MGDAANLPGRLARFLLDRCRDYGVLQGPRMAIAYARESMAPRGAHFALRPPGIAHPVVIRAGTSDIRVFDQIFGRREVDFPLSRDPRVIVDAGANIGLASIAFATRYPEARIIALELDRANYEVLVENVRPYERIIPVHCGIWSRATRLGIANPEAEAWSLRGAEVGDCATQGPGVEAVGVLDVLQRFGLERIDLFKIDIEGGEVEVLGSGADAWIGRVGSLAVELHDHWIPGCAAALRRAVGGRRNKTTVLGEYHLVEFSPA